MDILERYLAVIRRDLPAEKADDIVAELRDDLLTRIEAREDALGRPLDKRELEALLRDFGRPIVVAARYREHQYLIGPETYPFYVAGLKAGAMIVAIVAAVRIGVDLAFGPRNLWQLAVQNAAGLLDMLVMAFGIVTLIFALIERRGGVKPGADWSLDDLPSIDDLARDSRRDAPLEIVFGALFLLWWFAVIPFPFEGWRQFTVTPAPVWAGLFWPIGITAVARLAVSLLALAPARLTPLRHALAVGSTIAGILIVAALYQAGHWVDVMPGASGAAEAARVEESINLALRIALVVCVIAWTLGGLGGIWKWWRARAARAA